MKTPRLAFALLAALSVASCARHPHPSGGEASSAGVVETQPAEAAAEQPSPSTTPGGGVVATTAVIDSGMSFTDMDRNMDSGVTRDELAPNEVLRQRFNEVDTSGDGTLSVAEIERFRSGSAGIQQPVMTDNRSFAQMDANGDGRITHDELGEADMLERHFEEADVDHDGSLSAAEVDSHRAAMAAGE
jgi:Ca2+-binding EF-hand superfamily protein